MTEVLRDFIYLDEERLRSFSAQLLQGVPESAVKQFEREVGGAAKGEAGLLSFLKAQGEVDYRYRKSGSETRSLHHHVYTLFEEALDDRRFLQTVDVAFPSEDWNEDHFVDGEFVKIRGAVHLIDHSRVLTRLQAMPKFTRAVQAIVTAPTTREAAESKDAAAQRRQMAQQFGSLSGELKKLPFEQLASFGEQLYDSAEFRLKVRPEGAPAAHIFAGQGKRASLVDLSILLNGSYRTPLNAQWIVVGQVTSAKGDVGADPMPTGNGLEDAIESMAGVFESLSQVSSSIVFPALEIFPVAIYREVTSREF